MSGIAGKERVLTADDLLINDSAHRKLFGAKSTVVNVVSMGQRQRQVDRD